MKSCHVKFGHESDQQVTQHINYPENDLDGAGAHLDPFYSHWNHYYVSPLESCGAGGVTDSSYYTLSVLKSRKWEVRERGKGKVWFGTGEYLPWLACV